LENSERDYSYQCTNLLDDDVPVADLVETAGHGL
jgi:hypothetical protein